MMTVESTGQALESREECALLHHEWTRKHPNYQWSRHQTHW
jgi:hypothetical protein